MKWLKPDKKFTPAREIEVQLTIADQVSRLVIGSARADDLAREVVRALVEFVPIDWALLALVERPAGTVRLLPLVGAQSSAEPRGEDPSSILPLQGTPFGWVAENLQALLEANLDSERLFMGYAYEPAVKSVVHMPLFYQGDVFGVLSTGCYRTGAYQESELRLLRHVAAHLAVAVKSSLLLQQNLETQALLTNLDELLAIIASNQELPLVFPDFARRLREVLPFDCLALHHIEGTTLRVLASYCEREQHPAMEQVCLVQDTVVPWMQEHRQIHVAQDLAVERTCPIQDLHYGEGFRGEINVPLYTHGKLFARLQLASYAPYDKEMPASLGFLKELGHYLSTPVQAYILYSSEKQRFEWLAALAHHLRNPLSPVLSSSKLLVDELQREQRAPLLRAAQNIASGAQNINRNLKLFWDLSEVQSPGFVIEPIATPILAVLRESAAETQGAPGIQLALELPDDLPAATMDPGQTRRVLRILLDNAAAACVRAAPEGKVTLRARSENASSGRSGGAVIVEVRDSGKGFTSAEIEQMLRPYRIAEADRRATPELTLNIAIATRIIELQGGKLWLESEPGKGATFGFSLPLARSD